MIYDDLETALTYNGTRQLESIVLRPKREIDEETAARDFQFDEFVKINGILFLLKFVVY